MGDAARSRLGTVRRWLASVRVRMLVGYVLLITVALVAAILLTRHVQLSQADREIELEQVQEAEELRLFAEKWAYLDAETPETNARQMFESFLSTNVPADEEGFYTLVDGTGWNYSPGSPNLFDTEQRSDFPAGEGSFTELWNVTEPARSTSWTAIERVGEVRSLAVPVRIAGEPVGVFVIASFPADDYQEVDQLVTVLALAGLAVVALTTALAWSLTGRVLRPVRDLTVTARQISDTDLSARIPVDGRDELAELGTTFNAMVDRLEEGFDSQRKFLDDVAHELRTPITIARGHLEILGDDPDERAETVEIVTDELDRMSRYVGDLLLLAKAERPDFLILRPVDIGELATDVFTRVSALGQRNWVLDQSPPEGRVAVLADPERLTQALLNLADNAVGHTADGDEIGIGVVADDTQLRLWIRDTGPGVDPSLAESLFDRHTRGVSSRTRRSEGAGIGLSIVDAIARAHGGTVEMDNRPGHGVTFFLVLPVRTGLPPPGSADAQQGATP